MCCIRINTDTMLALLFYKGGKDIRFSIKDLEEFASFLSEYCPAYMMTDFSESVVKECIKVYPELFRETRINGMLGVMASKRSPNLNYFLNAYNWEMINYLDAMTVAFITMKR